MINNHKQPKITLSASVDNVCTVCGHKFVAGDEVLMVSALFKVTDGKLVLDDHFPGVICFPRNDDGHYAGKKTH